MKSGISEEIKEPLLDCVKYAFNEVDSNHNWSVSWKKIRDLLVLGKDKEKYFLGVHNKEDDDAMIEINGWLVKKNLTMIDDDYIENGDSGCGVWELDQQSTNQNITFSEAVEFVKTFWKHDYIVTINTMINKQFKKRVEYLLMI